MSAAIPRSPTGLGRSGRRLWRAVFADVAPGWRLDARELVLLEQVARTADLVAELEAVIERDGVIVQGSQGQDRAHPAFAETRAQRQLIASLLGRIELEPPQAKTGRLSARQRDQLRDARRARWGADDG